MDDGPNRADEEARRSRFALMLVVGYGFVPIWMSVAGSALLALAGGGEGFSMIVALSVVFTLPYCAMTLPIAFLGLAAYKRVDGDHGAKKFGALTVVAALSVIALLIIALLPALR